MERLFGFAPEGTIWIEWFLLHAFGRHHHHHGLHHLHLAELTHGTWNFARHCHSSLWMLVCTVRPGAVRAEFAFNLRMEINAFLTIGTCWEVFAALGGMNVRTFFNWFIAIWEVLTLDFLFCFTCPGSWHRWRDIFLKDNLFLFLHFF